MTTRFALALALLAQAGPAAADAPVTISFFEDAPPRRQDSWVAVEAPVVVVPRGDSYATGLAPSFTVFHDNGHGAVGARFRTGLVSDRMTREKEPLSTLGFVFRAGVRGPWVEVGGGAGQEGARLGLAAEAGVGVDFAIGTATLSLSARYLHFDLDLGGDGRTDALLGGLGVTFGHAAPPPRKPRPAPGTILTVTVREHATRD